jgi:hypothetical protein
MMVITPGPPACELITRLLTTSAGAQAADGQLCIAQDLLVATVAAPKLAAKWQAGPSAIKLCLISSPLKKSYLLFSESIPPTHAPSWDAFMQI